MGERKRERQRERERERERERKEKQIRNKLCRKKMMIEEYYNTVNLPFKVYPSIRLYALIASLLSHFPSTSPLQMSLIIILLLQYELIISISLYLSLPLSLLL